MNERRIGMWIVLAVVAGMSLSVCSCRMGEDGWDPTTPSAWSPTVYAPPVEPAPATRPAATAPATVPAAEPVTELTLEQAVLLALENNRALRVERLSPEIQRTFIEQERAVFDPVLSADVALARERAEARTGGEPRTSATGAGAAASVLLPTGTTVEATVDSERTWGAGLPQWHATRAGVSVTAALLEGRGVAVNLARLRQARLDVLFSDYELRGFAEALVAQVEATYWRYVLARRQVAIVEESLKLAEKQLDDTNQRIRVGQLAETERAAAEAEIALRREALINARSAVSTLAARLVRLVQPGLLGTDRREPDARTEPVVPPMPLEQLANHVAVALRMRPDLRQAEILIQRDDLEIVRTRNGLLPRMDLFIALGKTGYADSFVRSVADLPGEGYDVFAGLAIEQPAGNRDARARHSRAMLTRRQRSESLDNLRDLVRQDVELAFIEVRRARGQVDATAVTRKFQEEKLRAETAKFRNGKSTALLVAAAQRDLLASQVSEVEAVTNYLNARVALYLVEGSLLARRGIVSPGAVEAKPAAAADGPAGQGR